jgi:hypothetical protein
VSRKRKPAPSPVKKSRWLLRVAAPVFAIGVPLAIYIPGWIEAREIEEAPRVSLRDALAARLSCAPLSLQMNVPPAAGRYPGAILVRTPENVLLPVTFEHRPDDLPGPTFELQGAAVTSASAALNGSIGEGFSLDAKADEWLDVTVQLRDGQVIEKSLGEIRASLADNEDVVRLRERGKEPEVVVRAFEAMCDLVLKQRSNLESEQWAKVMDAAVKSGAKLNQDGSLVFKSKAPSVIAFQSQSVRIISDEMSAGQGRVKLDDAIAFAPDPLPDAAPSPTRTLFAGVASSKYLHAKMGDLPAAGNSVSLAASSMKEAGVAQQMILAQKEALKGEALLAWVADVTARSKEMDAGALVFYWVGHSISLPNGQLYLVMGTYRGDLKEDVGTSERRDRLSDPNQPLSGTNIDDLVAAMQAIEDTVTEDVRGLVPLVTVCDLLEEARTPFIILVDGCFPADGIDELRDELYLTEWGDYFGPNLAPDMSRYSKAIGIYGKRPHLTSPNPVILAAVPGSTARVQPHPWSEWDFGPGVAPLASRIAWNVRRFRGSGEALSWGDLLSLLADQRRGIGELSVRGTITWSDFSEFKKMPLLSGQ